MNKATPIEMRKALDSVEVYKSAGILFVPMPVFSESERLEKFAEACERLRIAEEEARANA